MKKLFKRNVLRRLLAFEDLDITKVPLLIDLFTVCEDLSSAWESVEQIHIKNCWKKLYQDVHGEEPIETTEFIDLISLAQQIPALSNFTEEELDEWLAAEIEPFYDEWQIIEAVNNDKDPLELVFDENLETSSSSSHSGETTDVGNSIQVSAPNFDDLLAWAENQEECKPEWINALKDMKQFAQQSNQI